MNTKILIISSFFLFSILRSQTVTGIYKVTGLLNRINHPDTTYVVNFWATWCKPCIQELPAFDSLNQSSKNRPVKIILVSLDFKEDLHKKVNPFLQRNHVKSQCVLLDEVNGNDFINKISSAWTGAIPGTLFKRGAKTEFLEKKVTLNELEKEILKVMN